MAIVKESWCQEHPHEYALSSGLCTHLDCVKKIIWTHAKSWRMIHKNWSYICKLGVADDCCIFLVGELLREEKDQGKKPTLNKHWLKFRLQKYIAQHMRKGDLPMTKVPVNLRKKFDQLTCSIDAIKDKNAHLLDELVWAGAMRTGDSVDLEEQTSTLELKDLGLQKFGESVMLFLTDEISNREYTKLLGIGIAPAKEYSQLVKKHLKELFTEGEWLPTVDEDVTAFRTKYNVKHRI